MKFIKELEGVYNLLNTQDTVTITFDGDEDDYINFYDFTSIPEKDRWGWELSLLNDFCIDYEEFPELCESIFNMFPDFRVDATYQLEGENHRIILDLVESELLL